MFVSGIYAQTPAPSVSTPIYYCQGSTAIALTATPTDPSATLRWYSALTGGTEFSSAPIPSTTSVANTSYYVTQTIGGLESTPRTRIEVRVLADNGSSILDLKCFKLSGTPRTGSPEIGSESGFSWNNTPSVSNQYSYFYTINEGTPIDGSRVQSHLYIPQPQLQPGNEITLTLWHTDYPCDLSVQTCWVPCPNSFTPTFDPVNPICEGEPAPVLPKYSKEGVSGTWNPPTVDNTITKNYVFTPFGSNCSKGSLIVVVNPDSPGFSDFTICSGSSVPNLDSTSPNGVTGSWDEDVVDNLNSADYTFTPDSGQCASPQTINVTVIPSNTLTDFTWTVTEAFAENQKITVSATAAGGNYLYQLDDGPFQSNPVFEQVASGSHSITVTDEAGCSAPITKDGILVVNFPKYFTPNNDGFNDTWNVSELSSQPQAYIHIFDRYGKFLKQISPNANGWNGSYNGYLLPADDYWFVIHYKENNIDKEFKSHFSLKR
ncbi:hypothetical protein FFL01_11980 [Flavobacterium flevense]|uniref:Ig-like domain-containing protein n=1 Tax=Flavobacterium flevense TaxID=983 RepID=A0A4Y4AWD6_9FLAO|nr:hypothetical protein FFL01_11980 [Flavobacterium flevense]